jgi:gliding motility-associated-like protein
MLSHKKIPALMILTIIDPNRKHLLLLKLIGLLLVWSYCITTSYAQTPVIQYVSKTSGSMEQIVTMKGSGFGTDATKVLVMFGAARADIVSVSDQVLTVKIPALTTYDNIAVTNLTSNLTGYTQNPFLLSFHGDDAQPFNPNNLEGQFNFPGGAAKEEGLYDLCLCDLDGDRKSDLATASDNFAKINIYRNTGTGPGNVAFNSNTAINLFSRTLQIKCGDLNGDGKTDLIATEKGSTNKIFILENNSPGPGTLSFTSQSIRLTNITPRHIEVADMDLDGKPELLVTSQASNAVLVLQNKSTRTSIIFAPTPVTISIPGISGTDALAFADIDGDRLPDIITAPYQTSGDIWVARNSSIPGSLSFENAQKFTAGTAINTIRAGDIDGDGKADIAFTQSSASVGVLVNQSGASGISFGALKTFTTDSDPWGLAFGDLDGDGKADLVAASVKKKSLTILNNTSTSGNISFQATTKSTTYLNRHVTIGDVDSDGKPDIAFTSIDDPLQNIAASKVSIFRNKTCMIPEVTPAGPLNICSSNSVALTATRGGGIVYEWTNLSTNTTSSGTNTYTPAVSGEYNVKATAENGSCVPVSNSVKVTIAAGAASDPQPANNGPVCQGKTLILSLNNNLGSGFSYQWTDASGKVIGTDATVQINNVKVEDAGIYSVNVYAGDAATGCLARTATTTAQVTAIPDFSIQRSTPEVICGGQLSTLSVFQYSTDFTYQWYERTAGALSSGKSIVRGTSGEYYYTATSTNPNCHVATSSPATLIVADPPAPAFDAPASACQGTEITFRNNTSTSGSAEVFYTWSFGDSQTSNEREPVHIYTSANPSYSVTLSASYQSGACMRTATKSISITAAVPPVMNSSTGVYEMCEGQSLILSLSGSFNSYQWSTGSTEPSITATQPGAYTAEVTGSDGCIFTITGNVTALPPPNVVATAHPATINEGESTQLEASGLATYSWEPAISLSQADIPNPVARPTVSTLYTVQGKDDHGCSGETTVEVRIQNATASTKLKPSLFFSPNTDAINPYWTVENILDYPQCSVTIFDDKGVKVYEAKPYLNNWDGTMNGRALPDGVYYFVIRCDGQEKNPRTGSITLLR